MEWNLDNSYYFFTELGQPYLLVVLIAGITNGIIFAPASEHVYFLIYAYKGSFSLLGAFFAISNSLGHILLFKIAKLLRKIETETWPLTAVFAFIHDLFDTSEAFYSRYDRKFVSVLLLRCVPFYHSAVSIMASATDITHTRFAILTIAGNMLFFVLLNLAFYTFGSEAQLNWAQISLALGALSVGSLFVKRLFDRILRK